MRILSVIPINYKYASFNKNNGVNQNYNSNAPYVSKVNFGNAASVLPRNFGTVIENKLLRGGRPRTVEHFQALKEKGVTFLASLRGEDLDEADMAKAFGMEYIPMDGDKFLLYFSKCKNEFDETLKLVDEKIRTQGVGYVFCDRGETRTGLFVARYQSKILKKELPEVREHFLAHCYDPKFFDSIIKWCLGD
jgi:protein tyrosine/serine phosphatase